MHTAQLTFLVYAFVEMFEKEIVSQTVTSGTRMVYTASHHRLSQPFRTGILVGAIRLAKSYKSRYRKRTNRSESVGVCDHASCDVSGQELQKQISHDDQPFGIGRCTSWHLGFCGYDHPFTKLDQICKPLILIGQTTVLEGGTKDAMRISNEALFHGSWPK